MLSVALVAIDATILATAVPSIVGDLGGFTQFPWLFSVYLLAQAISVPVYGKLSDLRGRKPIMLIGIGLFVAGSVLCGVAWSMPSLIVFRLLQGLGAGAIQPVAMTIVGDLYSLAERARVQGYIASVWGVSSVVGPTLGGVFSDYLSWRWIFFVNIPIGAAAAYVFWRRFSENITVTRHRIDYLGTILLASGGTLLLLGLLEGGVMWEWNSATSILILAGAVIGLTAFAVVERRAPEPVLPLWVLARRVLNAANASALLVGVLLIGLSTYVPLYAQSVLGTSALVAGFALAGMTLGWPIAASLAGRLYLRVGFRVTMLGGTVIAVIGCGLLLTISPDSPVVQLGLACFVIGVGLGFTASPSVVAAQSSVGWQSRGVVTGANMFARSVGSAVGVAAFGALANAVVAARIGGSHQNLESVPASVLAPAVHDVFVGAAISSLVLVVAAAFMPNRIDEAPEN